MSLQVWLPLIKDLRQQGVLNTPGFSLNAFTQEAGGKLGQYCYTDRGIIHFTEDFLANSWSLACWVKSTSWSANNDIILCKNSSESTSSQFYLSIINGASFNLGINGGSSNGAGTYSYTFSTNTWYHVAATYDGTNYAMYINGNKVKSGTCTTAKPTGLLNLGIGCRSTNAGGTASTGNANKRLNDVRVYDHALSQMEVKELSKGLVLHYPLDRNGWGQENLDNFSSVVSNWTMDGLTGSNYTDSVYGNVIKLVTSATNKRMYHNVVSTLWQSGQVYTVSFLAKADTNGRTCDMSRSIADFSPTFTLTTQWKRYSGKITSTATPGGGTLSFRIHQSGATVYITQIKLEKGEIATPYCPSSSEALYTTLGLNGTTEYDCSGYCNNGMRTGTFTWTSDTPKYSVSTAFSGSQYITENNEIETTDSTIAAWVKTSLSANAFILDCRNSSGAGKQPIYQYTNGSIQSGGASQYVTTNTGLLVANTWIHLAIVQSGSSLLVYKNGSLFQTLSCTNSPIIKPTVGARYSLSSLLPSGSISDVRIYATALSADDVLSLYNNSAYVDSSGNVYGAVH